MNMALAGRLGVNSTDRRKLFWAVFGCLAVVATAASALFLRDKYMYGALVLATPLALVVVSSPRLALYQFVFSLFFSFSIAPGLALVDLSAVLLLLAGLIDTLVSRESANRPTYKKATELLFYRYLALTLIVAFTAIFAFHIELSWRPVLRLLFISLAFLAIVRLLRVAGAGNTLKLFFWLTAAHGCIAVFQFIASGGALRAFGFTGKALDDLTMLALPIGLAFYLGSTRSTQRTLYALGSLVVFAALLATQSRAPIIFGVFGAALTLFWGYRGLQQDAGAGSQLLSRRSAAGRIKSLIALLLAIATLVAIFDPGIIIASLSRFERLITTNPGGTFRLRLTLWKSAWMVFQDNPLVGIGPGNFKVIGDAYATLHLDPARQWIQGLSAHNLLLNSLAETGILGGAALLALFWRQFILAQSSWKRVTKTNVSSQILCTTLALAIIAALLLLTTLLEAGWLWSQTGFIAALMLALIAVNHDRTYQTQSAKRYN